MVIVLQDEPVKNYGVLNGRFTKGSFQHFTDHLCQRLEEKFKFSIFIITYANKKTLGSSY